MCAFQYNYRSHIRLCLDVKYNHKLSEMCMMSLIRRSKGGGYFLTWTLLFLWHQTLTYGQSGQPGYFPNLEDLAPFKPVRSSSTCGATATDYCRSSKSPASLQTCFINTCVFGCCANCGSSKPDALDLVKSSLNQSVTQDGEPRNGSSVNSYRFQGNSYIQALRFPPVNYVNLGFTISVWIKQKAGNRG